MARIHDKHICLEGGCNSNLSEIYGTVSTDSEPLKIKKEKNTESRTVNRLRLFDEASSYVISYRDMIHSHQPIVVVFPLFLIKPIKRRHTKYINHEQNNISTVRRLNGHHVRSIYRPPPSKRCSYTKRINRRIQVRQCASSPLFKR